VTSALEQAMARPGASPRAVRELFEHGYTVFERAYSEDEVRFLREHLMCAWETLGRPALRSNPPTRLANEVEVGPAGLIFHKLTRRSSQLAPRLYKREIIETLRAVLGDSMYLELPAGVLSDASRPFFDWHTHIDGVDDAHYANKRPFPTFDRSHRVTHLLYLDDLTPDNGQLLVYPRKLTDPTPPPFDPKLEYWTGQVAIDCPRGSVVVLEQCTWHAARRKTSEGVRAFVGSYFAAADAAQTPLADDALTAWQGDDELFLSVLPGRGRTGARAAT
jgi:hypothetical protein